MSYMQFKDDWNNAHPGKETHHNHKKQKGPAQALAIKLQEEHYNKLNPDPEKEKLSRLEELSNFDFLEIKNFCY